ncbi:M48 family metallopeptidase [Puniceicoccus vermicola]|uniref:M48 family metallopeptidase n=1 Tax=Puniceicoccus vermicola TaxID=388746 RepID=A0A7X1AZK7_9BACT|nr:M48 family metallopeptidase [Puniceicoccus vermicola]MBC2602847.1 M48 family metallopeptidase [Puniceicoccus vermicola]
MRSIPSHFGALLLILTLSLTGCYTVPETGRSSFTLLPESQVKSMGISSFEEIKETSPLITSGRNYEMIQRVGNRIAKAVGNDMPDAEWEFIYIDEDQVNAFALPGGKIAVYDGMFDVIDSEDELAFILGHEVAHVTARHSNQRLSQAMVIAGIGVGVGFAIDDLDSSEKQLILAAYGLGTTVGIALPYSRLHESEADYIGQLYMARAGYNPEVAPGVWVKMAEKSPNGTPGWLSTHPTHEDRTQALQESMPKAKEEYRNSRYVTGER